MLPDIPLGWYFLASAINWVDRHPTLTAVFGGISFFCAGASLALVFS